jgi:peroxiredoxin
MKCALAPLVLAVLGCASAPPAAPSAAAIALRGSDGLTHRLAELSRGAPFTVVTFFSAECPVQRAHDARLRALADRFRERGVAFVAVDSEATATPAGDAAEAHRREYPYPLLTDAKGILADALGAEYATYSVVLDGSLRVRYRGAVDADKHFLHESAEPYLREALDRLLAGREPEHAETEALGCALRR